MADEGTFATTAEILRKAGYKVSGAIAEADTNQFIKEIEGEICCVARYDFVSNYSSVNSVGKEFLRLAATNGAAIPVIAYSLKYITEDTSRAEAEDRLNVLDSIYKRCLGTLMDKKVTEEFMT